MSKIKPDFNTPPPIIDENSSMYDVAEKIKYLDHNNITLANSSIVFVKNTEESIVKIQEQLKKIQELVRKKDEISKVRKSAPAPKVQTFSKDEIVSDLLRKINPSELEKFKLDDAIKKSVKKQDKRTTFLVFSNIILFVGFIYIYFNGANSFNKIFQNKYFNEVKQEQERKDKGFVEKLYSGKKIKTMVFRSGTKYKCKGYEQYDLSIEEATNMDGYEKDGKFYFEAALEDGKNVECYITSDYF